jgi:hypothetical protein
MWLQRFCGAAAEEVLITYAMFNKDFAALPLLSELGFQVQRTGICVARNNKEIF